MNDIRAFVVAGALGFLLGFEREHHEWREHHQAIPTGTRTMTVIALCGAIAARLDPAVIAAGLVAVGAVLAVGYWRSRPGQTGGTTEVTAIATYLLGALCFDNQALAVSLAAGLAALLELKRPARRLVREVVTDAEVTDAVIWFALAFVIWPLLPTRTIGGTFGISPTSVWRLVLLLTGIGWLGYIATRTVGERRGLLIVGAAGGFVSGSATTGALARMARRDPTARRGALGGALLASVATCIQIELLALVTSPPTARLLLVPMVAGSAVLTITAIGVVGRGTPAIEPAGVDRPPDRRPLALKGSLVAAGFLTTALVASRALVDRFGAGALTSAAAATGLADVHAATLAASSLVKTAAVTDHRAVVAIAAALAVNTGTKITVAAAAGGRAFAGRFALLLVPAIISVGSAFALVAR